MIIFTINLVQDVNSIWSLASWVAIRFQCPLLFVVSSRFYERDKNGIWAAELIELSNNIKAEIFIFENARDAINRLNLLSGLIIAPSESSLNAHKEIHELFKMLSNKLIKVTLQHGFECVGFHQSLQQDDAHGKSVHFASDFIFSWMETESLRSVAPSQKHKLISAGPPFLLRESFSNRNVRKNKISGLICENMHSPRMGGSIDLIESFISTFHDFVKETKKLDHKIYIRPHPGGQYFLRNNITLPDSVLIENDPIYKTNLKKYSFAISAPSSVLIDLIFAGVPVAVWQDSVLSLDLSNYAGLQIVRNASDWVNFAEDAVLRPEFYIEKQQDFLNSIYFKSDSTSIVNTYYSQFNSFLNFHQSLKINLSNSSNERVLIFAPNYIPTVQLSFLIPLQEDVYKGNIAIDLVTEVGLNLECKGRHSGGELGKKWLQEKIDIFKPSIVVFCRWAGPNSEWLFKYLKKTNIPIIYHLDDDLLNVPVEIGKDKWNYHNHPDRLASLRFLLEHSDIVYCSTLNLKNKLLKYGFKSEFISGDIVCSAGIKKENKLVPVKKVGYMGIGHEADLMSILPALIKYLELNREVEFELFGTIPLPRELERFGQRVKVLKKIDDYSEFIEFFSNLDWQIGICPLVPIDFNFLKSNNKWVEYTSLGIAVVATKSTIYDECCADDCGLLANTIDDWFDSLNHFTLHPEKRFHFVENAQNKLVSKFSHKHLRNQVFSVFSAARSVNNSLSKGI